jgi:hypothetical protein
VNQSRRYEVEEMICINRSFFIFSLVRFIFLTGYRYDRDGNYPSGLNENEECIQSSYHEQQAIREGWQSHYEYGQDSMVDQNVEFW